MTVSAASEKHPARVWWSNASFFVGVHIAAAIGIYYYPWYSVPRATLWLTLFFWQASSIGVTVGYHRLYSHRAFRARLGVRILVACLGSSALQGSIKWWCLRHRLHHRFTDDPVHDPYAATRGLLWSHMGWIFFKPRYERMNLIDADDLDNDPVVRFQHKYYIPIASFFGLALPPMIGAAWSDPVGAYIWAGLLARILAWHCTFFVNSLAHWDGLQPYSDENTSKSNLLLALLTCGEGNHNFHHAFPHDFRSGPSLFDWDPSKWLILLLHELGLASGLRRARDTDVSAALEHMAQHEHARGHMHGFEPGYHAIPEGGFAREEDEPVAAWAGDVWTLQQALEYARAGKTVGRCTIIIDGFVVDATAYLGEHPGGAAIIRKYSVRADPGKNAKEGATPKSEEALWKEASWAFHGGLNQHTWAAKRRMRELRVAKLSED
ncbi:hypothetical protein CERSUDRAFT_87875 [Gelatoporia subvermispora B]|uniref:Acyl-CoA desaturase n=1 Tax=Ceriporiopsis subvermispora (strain B) TaxID=914234 RepID=M2R110_CERS8|nr:hypothetical protein CERSUDRAFT_87875 [Gelatoporia subvermispora B]